MQTKLCESAVGIFSILLIVASLGVSAEVYKWTDAAGKVHYSDQKPEKQPEAKDVTKDIKKANSDSSNKEQQKMSNIFRKENDADRRFKQQQEQEAQPNAEQQAKCQEARKTLKKLEGRVMFLDENGKEIHTTEAERRIKAQALRDQIDEHCSE